MYFGVQNVYFRRTDPRVRLLGLTPEKRAPFHRIRSQSPIPGPDAETTTSEAVGALGFRTPRRPTFVVIGAPPCEHNIRTLFELH